MGQRWEGMRITLLARDVRNIEESFIDLLRWSPGSKEDKQEYFRRKTKIRATKQSYRNMWGRLKSEFDRSGAGELVFDYVLDHAPPELEGRLTAAQEESHEPLGPNEPRVVEELFWKKGTPRRIGEHLLNYLGDHMETAPRESNGNDDSESDAGRPYDVALSFAGEQRDYVKRVYQHLKEKDVDVFYDRAKEVEMWGKDLNEYLQRIFRDEARYCVMFLSEDYVEKNWPRKEGQAALEREVEENREYILPVRFDSAPLPGLPGTVTYLEAPENPKVLSEKIESKIDE